MRAAGHPREAAECNLPKHKGHKRFWKDSHYWRNSEKRHRKQQRYRQIAFHARMTSHTNQLVCAYNCKKEEEEVEKNTDFLIADQRNYHSCDENQSRKRANQQIFQTQIILLYIYNYKTLYGAIIHFIHNKKK